MIGVLSYVRLRVSRRVMTLGLSVFAAVVTPPISMLVLAVALTVLFEVAVQFARINDKRRDRRAAAEGDNLLDDETDSDLIAPDPLISAEPDSPQSEKYRRIASLAG